MEREEEEEMLREKRSLQRWREAQSPAHPSGGSSPWMRRLRHPPSADGSHEPGSGARVGYPGLSGTGDAGDKPKLWKQRDASVDGVTFPWV